MPNFRYCPHCGEKLTADSRILPDWPGFYPSSWIPSKFTWITAPFIVRPEQECDPSPDSKPYVPYEEPDTGGQTS